MNIFLSIIVPVFNESKRIKNIHQIIKYLKSKDFASELVVVSDGSTDDTLKKLLNFKRKYRFKILNLDSNRGKGYAIKKGMLEARGKYRLFTDIDLSVPIDEFDEFIPLLKRYDIIIGIRKNKLIIHQPKLRELLGKGFTYLSNKVLNVNVSDFTCGFKCFSKRSAEQIFGRLTVNRWGFDAESLFLASYLGFRIKEFSVTWINKPYTKVKLPQDIFQSLYDLVKIRIKRYERKN